MTKTTMYTEERPPDLEQLTVEEDESARAPMTKCQILLLNVSWFGLSLMLIVLSVEVLPPQIQAMVGEGSKGRWLGGIVSIGGVLTFICAPLVGMQSDRLVSAYGKRRPVILGAAIILCISLYGMAFSAPQITISQSAEHPELCITNGTGLVAQRCRHHENTTRPISWILSKLKPGTSPIAAPKKKNKFTYDNDTETSGNIWLFAVFYMLMTVSGTALMVTYSALLADKAHPQQRGLTSGVMGCMLLLGQVAGACLGFGIAQLGVLWIYSCVVILTISCILITVFTTSEPPSKATHNPLSVCNILLAFFEPLKEVNFRWVFITKFLMQQGLYSVMAFLEYWLADMTVLPFCWSPQRSVAMFLFPLMSTAAILSVTCGCLSDKLQRRKVFVIISCLAMSSVAVVFAGIEGEDAYIVAIAMAFVFGAGFGCFQAVDFALLMDVLPDNQNTAKDIAVYAQAAVLAQTLATPIGGVVVDSFEAINCQLGLGYRLLFVITAIYFMLSGIFVLKISGVR